MTALLRGWRMYAGAFASGLLFTAGLSGIVGNDWLTSGERGLAGGTIGVIMAIALRLTLKLNSERFESTGDRFDVQIASTSDELDLLMFSGDMRNSTIGNSDRPSGASEFEALEVPHLCSTANDENRVVRND